MLENKEQNESLTAYKVCSEQTLRSDEACFYINIIIEIFLTLYFQDSTIKVVKSSDCTSDPS